MRLTIWLCASVWLAACAVEAPSVETANDPSDRSTLESGEAEATSELGAAITINALASDSLERIHAEAVVASAAACHGTTTCPGGVLISGTFTVDCGSQVCTTTGCGKPDVGPPRVFKAQPREQYEAFAMPNGLVCLAYHPTTRLLLNTCCILPPL